MTGFIFRVVVTPIILSYRVHIYLSNVANDRELVTELLVTRLQVENACVQRETLPHYHPEKPNWSVSGIVGLIVWKDTVYYILMLLCSHWLLILFSTWQMTNPKE